MWSSCQCLKRTRTSSRPPRPSSASAISLRNRFRRISRASMRHCFMPPHRISISRISTKIRGRPCSIRPAPPAWPNACSSATGNWCFTPCPRSPRWHRLLRSVACTGTMCTCPSRRSSMCMPGVCPSSQRSWVCDRSTPAARAPAGERLNFIPRLRGGFGGGRVRPDRRPTNARNSAICSSLPWPFE